MTITSDTVCGESYFVLGKVDDSAIYYNIKEFKSIGTATAFINGDNTCKSHKVIIGFELKVNR